MMRTQNRGVRRMLRRWTGRVSDAGASSAGVGRHRSVRGLSLLELLVSMAVFNVTLGLGTPRPPHSVFGPVGADRHLIADLRHIQGNDGVVLFFSIRAPSPGEEPGERYRMRLLGSHRVDLGTNGPHLTIAGTAPGTR